MMNALSPVQFGRGLVDFQRTYTVGDMLGEAREAVGSWYGGGDMDSPLRRFHRMQSPDGMLWNPKDRNSTMESLLAMVGSLQTAVNRQGYVLQALTTKHPGILNVVV